MLRLITFGGLGLIRDGVPIRGPGAQRRRLAVLAVLAAAGRGAGVSRDRLLAYFSPEQDADSARRALNQSIYMLRRELGARELVVGTTELALDASVIESDVQDFEAAIDGGEVQRALDVYRGPFLDGAHIAEAPDFEEWLHGQRKRLRSRLLRALDSAATQALAGGELRAATRLWMHAMDLEPYDGRRVVMLADAFVAAGDPAAGINCADTYEQRLRNEMGIAPTTDVMRALDRLRGSIAAQPPAALRAEPRAPSGAPRMAASAPAHRWRRLSLVSVSTAALLVVTWALRPHAGPLSPGRSTVIVLPFSATGDTGVRHLADQARSLIEMTLGSFDEARIVPPASSGAGAAANTSDEAAAIAAAQGADLFVLGSVEASQEQVYVRASLRARAQPYKELATAATEGSATRARRLFTEVAARLVSPLFGPRASDRLHEAGMGTSSDDAFSAYLLGETRFRETRFLDAAGDFSDATRLDPTFALAWYRLAVSLDWAGRPPAEVMNASEHARALAARLSPRARLLLDAHYQWRSLHADSAESLYRSVLEQIPGDEEASFFLGEVLFHENPPRGRPIQESRPFFEQHVARDPGDFDAWTHLQRLALLRHDAAALDSIEPRMAAIRGTAESEDWQYFRGLATGDTSVLATVLRVVRAEPVHWTNNFATRAYAFADARAAAALMYQALARPENGPDERALARQALTEINAAGGRMKAADSLALLLPATLGPEERVGLALLPFRSDSLDARRRVLREFENARRDVLGHARRPAAVGACGDLSTCELHIGELAFGVGDTMLARSMAAALERRAASDTAARAAAAYLGWLLAGDDEASAAEPAATVLWRVPLLRERERYRAAELRARKQQIPAALRWFDSFEPGYLVDAPYAAPGHLRSALLLARAHDAVGATAEIDRTRALWNDADPGLRSVLVAYSDSVRIALGASDEIVRR